MKNLLRNALAVVSIAGITASILAHDLLFALSFVAVLLSAFLIPAL